MWIRDEGLSLIFVKLGPKAKQELAVQAYDLTVEEARDRLVLATAGDSSTLIHVSFEAFFGATADCRTLVRVQYSTNQISFTLY